MNILLFGPPGSGKGTQSELLIQTEKMSHISTGDLLRKARKERTPLGIQAQQYLDQGKLVPDGLMIELVDEVLEGLKDKSFILDGFPRTIPQANALDELLNSKKMVLSKAIFLNVPQETLVSRLAGRRVCEKCGATYHIETKKPLKSGVCDQCGGNVVQRSDDHEDVVKKRLQVYEESTMPLKDYYEKQGKLVEINGTGEVQDVFKRVQKELRN